MKFIVCFALLVSCAFAAEKGLKLNFRKTNVPKVVGGSNAALGEFPFQLSLQWGYFGFFQHVCGASIINENWAVTAGHCKTELPEGEYKVIAGIINLEKAESGQTIDVAKVIVHEDYKGGVNPNDIALLKLASPITLGDTIKAVILPEASADPTDKSMLSGWGSTSTTEDPIMPNDLQKATLPVLTYAECEDALTAIQGSTEPLAETNVCTGPLDGSMSACSGDSGGPLSQDGTLIGIVSWGFFPCGTAGAPSVFTKVSSFIDWINTNMK